MEQLNAVDVARLIVERCIDGHCPVSNLQLQKVLYFLQLEWMRRHDGTPLFRDDFVAWKYGPVIEEVYRVYSVFGGQKIDDLTEVDFYAKLADRDAGSSSDVSSECADEIMSIVRELTQLSPWDLVARSHKEGGAWYQAFGGGCGYGNLISKESMLGREVM